ncbi:MAG: hypothetical protein CM1200mP16_16160 [Nitrospina sp.]|nr:MAG: hypothetical protein CM1200mP16_16160 [Nitrospina sp.]
MFDYAHQAGVNYIVMNTNGTLLNEKMISQIIESPLNIIDFLLMGHQKPLKK